VETIKLQKGATLTLFLVVEVAALRPQRSTWASESTLKCGVAETKTPAGVWPAGFSEM